jgi:hypothetical protein
MAGYIIADPASNTGWSHLFEKRMPVAGKLCTVVIELECRFVYEVSERRLLHLDLLLESGTSAASEEDLWDLEDSLNHANPDAIDNPLDWGLTVSSNLPSWARCN